MADVSSESWRTRTPTDDTLSTALDERRKREAHSADMSSKVSEVTDPDARESSSPSQWDSMRFMVEYQHPYKTIAAIFALWKGFLFCIALCTPGEPYDTSASLILEPPSTGDSSLQLAFKYVLERFTRWDAIYFVKVAERGYLYEQEWAFGWGFTQTLGLLGKCIPPGFLPDPYRFVLVGMVLSGATHLASSYLLFHITRLLFPARNALALCAACLHVLSPAGTFLIAPAPEPVFSFLSFLGTYFFLLPRKGLKGNAQIVLSGVTWGLAATVRSNGILNGAILLGEFVLLLTSIPKGGFSAFANWVSTGIAGILVGAGLAGPQFLAWREYCGAEVTRPWCSNLVPSIYLFVQEHYWNVGFLRYWTPGNIPLFLLAAPMLTILLLSSYWAFKRQSQRIALLSVPQGILAIMAISSYHVQIILRLSSGYFVWYIWVADMLLRDNKFVGNQIRWDMYIVRWMLMYAAIQAVLYSAFLPPA